MALVCGCRDRGPSARAAGLLGGHHALQIGLEEGPREATLGRIVGARLTEGGAHVVVLDFVAPYVKVFDSQGRFVRAFLREGGGPGEAMLPTALGTSGDSLILVGDATRRVLAFGLDGKVRTQLPDPGFGVLSVTGVCGGEWLVYGPRFTGGRPTWLHRVRIGEGALTASANALPDSLASPIIPNGIGYGLVNEPGGAVLWHTLGARRTLVRWRCGDPEPAIVLEDGNRGEAVHATRRDEEVRMRVGPGSRSLAGIAAVAGRVVVGEHVNDRGTEDGHTELTLFRDGRRVSTVRVPGSYVIRDSRPGAGVLFSTGDPVPQVFLVGERAVLNLFGAN